MPTNPSFAQYTYDIEVSGDDRANALRDAIQNSWAPYARERVAAIRPADEYEGAVYAVEFKDEEKPPSLGGSVEALARHGWGYFTYTEDALYVARIIPTTDDEKEFVFEGRENAEFDLPAIRQTPDIELDEEMPLDNEPTHRDQRRIQSLRDSLLRSWPNETLDTIVDITYSTSDRNSYIINTESNSEFEEDDDGNLRTVHREIPDSPLETHADALLHNGWAVGTIKSNSLFVSRLKPLNSPEDNAEYGYKFEGSEGELMYTPRQCEYCSHEGYDFLVTDTRESEIGDREMPLYTRACKSCIEEHDYPTADEYREKQAEEREE